MVNKKLTNEVLLEGMTKDQQKAVLDRITQTVAETKQLQSKQVGANVELVLQALKRIESDMLKRVDGAASVVENRVKTIKDGRDGVNGADGRAGRDGRDGKNGADGRNGKDGINGVSGERGQDGVGVRSAYVDFDGSLIISLTDGQELNAGEVVPFDVAEKIRVISNGGGTSQFVIDTLADLQSQIDNISGGLTYKGTWNASTNIPALASSTGTKGWYYVVSTAGSTNLNGVTDWQVGDWAIYNGSTWQKIDQTNLVTSVSGRTGAITLTYSDLTGTVPTWNQNTTGTASNVTGTVAVANGGTGSTTASGARTNLGLVIGTDVLAPNGSAASLTSFPTLNQNTTGNAATATTATNVSGGTASVTTLTTSSTVTHNGGTANGVAYLNGSKVLTTGSALTFDGSIFGVSKSDTTNPSLFTVSNPSTTGSFAAAQMALKSYNGTSVVEGLVLSAISNSWSYGTTLANSAQVYTGLANGLALVSESSAGPIRFLVGTGAPEQMRLTSTGLGIGTSSPGFKLDVSAGNGTGIRLKSTGAYGAIRAENTGTTGGGSFTAFQNGVQTSIFGVDGAIQGNTSTDTGILADVVGGGIKMYTNGSATAKATLDASGNLGLGVTPSAWYTFTKAFQSNYLALTSQNVSGSAALLNNAYEDGNETYRYVTTNGAGMYRQTLGSHKFYTAPSGTAGNAISFTQAMTLNASGGLSLGVTTDPGAGSIQLGSGAYVGTGIGTGNTTGTYYGTNEVRFYTSAAERARIDSSGNFLVGATSSDGAGANRFQVGQSGGQAQLLAKTSTGHASIYATGTDVYQSWVSGGFLAFGQGPSNGSSFTERARIDSSGNLLVGTTSYPTGSTVGAALNGALGLGTFSRASDASLLLNTNTDSPICRIYRSGTQVGSISVTTVATLYNTASDYRLKTVIGPVANAGQRIDALQPVEYTWKADGSRTRGFLAHEFQEVYAGSVSGTKDAVDAEGKPVYQSMQASSSEVIADLVAEIQSLRQRLAAAGI